MAEFQIIQGDCIAMLKTLESESVHCCVTSPPYYSLRDYKVDGQIGLEETPQLFIAKMVEVFDEVRRVLRKDGVCFVNLGDSYARQAGDDSLKDTDSGFKTGRTGKSDQLFKSGNNVPPAGFKPKDLMLMPHRVAIALQDAGWYIRSDMPWVKRSAMPESVTDRPAKALEYVFMLTKSPKYFFDMEAVRIRMADSSILRQTQDTDSQNGSDRVPGKTNGAMKAVGTIHNRDRSLPNNRNGITGSLDETPAGSRNFRNADLWFSSIETPHGLCGYGDELIGLDVNPSGFSEAHFATFPTKLIEPLIKAATSEKGACAGCGAPYKRLREPSEAYAKYLGKGYHDHDADLEQGMHQNRGKNAQNRMRDETGNSSAEYITTGWTKTCKCETDEVRPCVVLDPFSGAGTTLLVSMRLGRDSIGLELNPEYIKIAERRLEHWHKPSPPKLKDIAMPLFGEV